MVNKNHSFSCFSIFLLGMEFKHLLLQDNSFPFHIYNQQEYLLKVMRPLDSNSQLNN